MTCGIHITRTDPCVHCARAARQTADALANVVPIPAAPKGRKGVPVAAKLTPEIQRLRGEGLTHEQIAARVGCSPATVSVTLRGITSWGKKVAPYDETHANRRKAHQYFSPLKGERAHAKTLPLPRNAGLPR